MSEQGWVVGTSCDDVGERHGDLDIRDRVQGDEVVERGEWRFWRRLLESEGRAGGEQKVDGQLPRRLMF
jgi:hypothetical protein